MKKTKLFTTDYRLITGYIIAFILLLISYLITLFSNRELIKQTEKVTNTHKVIGDIENLYYQVKDGVNGYRGYILTRDSNFLKPFYKSILSVDSIYLILEKEIKDNKNQQLHLKKMVFFIETRFQIIKNSLEYYSAHNNAYDSFLLKNSYVGEAVMDSIRLMAEEMQNHEKNLLITRSKKVDNEYKALNSIVVTSLIFALIFAAFGVVTFIKEKKAREDADKKVVDYQKELTQRIEELDKANKELIEIRREEKFASTGRIARIIANSSASSSIELTEILLKLSSENRVAFNNSVIS